MRHVTTKPVFGISDQVQHKLGCSATEDGLRLEFSDLGSRRIVLCSENKAADQLCSYRAADLRLFLHMQKAGFLMTRLMAYFLKDLLQVWL